MIIITKKIHRARLVAGFILLVLTIGFVGAGLSLARDIQKTEVLSVPQGDTKGIKSNEDRVAFLENRGWMVAQEAASIEDVLIPESFDASYDEYLALQKSQGFDLTAYAGKTVKRYTYQVNNYPGLQDNIWASLLVYKKEIIGGEVFCSQGDGFIQGLSYPTGTKTDGPSTATEGAAKDSANPAEGGSETTPSNSTSSDATSSNTAPSDTTSSDVNLSKAASSSDTDTEITNDCA